MRGKHIDQKLRTKEEMFDDVVRNAIDFIDSSLDDLDKRPKNGIVDFYTAIELFLKARLMTEHWTLIVTKPDQAILQRFRVGDFQSVNLAESITRLRNITDNILADEIEDTFDELRKHRNQIVHFDHTDYSDIAGDKARVIIKLWKSWHYLYELLTKRWIKIFDSYKPEIEKIHKRMLEQKDFIKIRYKELEPEVQNQIKSGTTVTECDNCHMASAIWKEKHNWGSVFICLVCQSHSYVPAPTNDTVQCDNCGIDFEFFRKGLNACPHCDQAINTEKLIALCSQKYIEGDGWWEPGEPHIAQCHKCKYPKPSVFFIDDLWSCVSCFDRGWQALSCPHCGEFVTAGDMDMIKYVACFKCEKDFRP